MVELEICSKFFLRELKINLLYFYVFLSNQITFSKSWKKLYEDSLLRRRFIYYRYSTVIISILLHRQIVWGLRLMICVLNEAIKQVSVPSFCHDSTFDSTWCWEHPPVNTHHTKNILPWALCVVPCAVAWIIMYQQKQSSSRLSKEKY